ncbi:GD21616 [Drosophila simulans]|uniref:GD21616 n=1 Tax=Drosophila simulans TaxID=7240 RepID=B4Q4W7_DROSI|nr:GD21616 [Drosophila simulans]
MADLPKERLEGSHAVEITGIDFCGHFFYKLELIKDLSTVAFLCGLKRFICTRRNPKQIWSDNATNFVGAKNELLELRRLFLSSEHQGSVQNFCLSETIDWRFIPPRSPHFGGLWEAAVKTAKHHFYRAVVPISENPADLDVLTPEHFLNGGPPSSFDEPDITGLNYNRLDSWQRISFLQQIFWSRWKEEYLTLLQQRSKWRTPKPGVAMDNVVLAKDENLPPMRWPLAKVIQLIPGRDGVARVAELRTASGVIRRAVNKLCLLFYYFFCYLPILKNVLIFLWRSTPSELLNNLRKSREVALKDS